MEKYSVQALKNSRVKKVIDQKPAVSWSNEVCTVYSEDSVMTAYDIANSLNMAHELRQLQPSAIKKQLLEIINKYR